MDFSELHTVVGVEGGESDDLWGWMAAHQLNFAPEHPSNFISDKFEIAKIPFLSSQAQNDKAPAPEKVIKVDPTPLPEVIPVKAPKMQSTTSKSTKPQATPDFNAMMQSSIITSTASSSAEEKWITLETPKNLIQKKQFNEKCLDMLTDVTAYAHHDPPLDLIADTVKGRKNGAFKYIEGDPSHPKESWKRDGFSWNQKGGWHVIYDNKLKRKTFTLQGDKNFKKSVTKQAVNVPHHDAIVVTYFYHPSENEDKKKRKKDDSSEELPPSKKTPPPAANAPFPPTVLQVCSCTHHNPQEEIIEQEKMLRHLIFGSLTENTILSFDDFINALVKNVNALPGLMKSRNPNAYDIPTKSQKASTFTKEEAKTLLPKVLGKTVNCIDFQRFFFMFGPCNALLAKLKDVFNFFHQRKDLAEKQVNGREKSRAIYPAPEPMCLVLTVYCPSEKRTKNYLLKNGDYGLQFQVSRSLWSVCYSNLTELLNSNPSLF